MHKNEIRAKILTYLFKNRFYRFSTKKLFFKLNIQNNCASIYNKVVGEILKAEYVVQKDNKIQWDSRYFIGECLVFGKKFYSYFGRDKYRVTIPIGVYPLDEDTVIVKMSDPKRLEADLVEILSRTKKHIFGTLATSEINGMAFVIPEDNHRYLTDIFIGAGQSTDPLAYCKVEVQINRYETKRKPCGTIVRMVRSAMEDTDKNTSAILARHGLQTIITQDISNDISKIKNRISQGDYRDRVKIDDRQVFMINDHRVSDIAFSARKIKDQYEIGIYTVDVATYISEGSQLDQAARKRVADIREGTYRISMLPNDIKGKVLFAEGKKRPAVAMKAIFNTTGHLVDFEFFEAIICPQTRLSVSDLNQYAKQSNEEFELKYCNLLDEVSTIKALMGLQDIGYMELYPAPRSSFTDRFNTYMKNLFDSVAAHTLREIGVPFLYCGVQEPDEFDIHRLSIQCEAIGMDPTMIEKQMKHMDGITEWMDSIGNSGVRAAVTEQIRLVIPREYFSSLPQKHFILGVNYHCTVSSPYTRYADLYNQRILKRYIRKTIHNESVLDRLRSEIEPIAEDINRTLRAIAEVEKELIGFESARLLEKDKDAIMSGIAYNVTPSGVFTVLDNGIRGLMKAENHTISDRIFEYETKDGWKKIKIGDQIKVRYDHYDMKAKRIIFEPIDQ